MTTVIEPTDRSTPYITASQQAYQQKDTTMGITRPVQLINEALSRARMRKPQTANSEAIRPARQIMISARREHDRLSGL
jgi:hypothetical protein